ncbi:MBL fold metallo-hydrolase [Enterobacter hormaechei]|uniref:MBL fold metallo-hydrolase n=1 Tax=Enterobacter hormaechei TaxID=158836 RepID=UPI00103E9A43|nr:MBL fold metallo-hydrolase [Enterobacter hormaechei]TBV79499.1 MBL fold metallo-hydrolase [Enterobacter hormaechei]TKY77252.1 MBL fold metallo-hydrolase [Enterobacter hormaechei]HED1659352.1 MBL fold metallo-hydrolase [Enterobacter hormaechei subsp. steigerwaltii]
MITLCKTCGTAYDEQPKNCPICDDERQYVPVTGQTWTDFDSLTTTHTNKWQQLEPQLFSIKTVPSFAINQRALLLRTPQGNVLWDCIANLDPATRALVDALGGISAIAISHPHYYTTMQEWAAAFNAPIYLHASDRQWVMRDSPAIRFWEEDALEIMPLVTLLRLGGHFAGGTVLHWQSGDGVLLAGDILQVTPGKDAVSFMWSCPNMLPLPARTVESMIGRLTGKTYQRLYGAFEGQNIPANADEIVQRSGQKYIACLG